MDDRVKGPTTRRRLGLLLLALVTLALAVGAASCGGDDEEAAAPPPARAEPAPAEPPAEPAPAETEPAETGAAREAPDRGHVPGRRRLDRRVLGVRSRVGDAGPEHQPGSVRPDDEAVRRQDERRGRHLRLHRSTFTGMEDGFDIDDVPPAVQEALQSDEYDVYFGPTNSGCMAGLPALDRRGRQVPDLGHRGRPPAVLQRLLAVGVLQGAVLRRPRVRLDVPRRPRRRRRSPPRRAGRPRR